MFFTESGISAYLSDFSTLHKRKEMVQKVADATETVRKTVVEWRSWTCSSPLLTSGISAPRWGNQQALGTKDFYNLSWNRQPWGEHFTKITL